MLGENDPIIIVDEFIQDASAALGKENVKAKVVKGAGHELVIDRADEIVSVVEEMHR